MCVRVGVRWGGGGAGGRGGRRERGWEEREGGKQRDRDKLQALVYDILSLEEGAGKPMLGV